MTLDVSAEALFREKHCDSPECTAMVPLGVRKCRSCVRSERRHGGGTGRGHPPKGRFEARVRQVVLVARILDAAEADHRERQCAESHAALLVAFSDYRRAVRLLDRGA